MFFIGADGNGSPLPHPTALRGFVTIAPYAYGGSLLTARHDTYTP